MKVTGVDSVVLRIPPPRPMSLEFADHHGLLVSPHVVHEISLQVAGALSNAFLVEYMNWAPPDLFVELPRCEGGWFRIPDRPGHGMALTPDGLEKYRAP
jgi:L-alanine-DL-glutamate epimerase-like enolase superfamily enzyme